MKLLKFGAPWCGPCRAMSKAKTLEKFAEKHPDVEVLLYDLPEEEDKDGKPRELSKDETTIQKLADKHGIEAIPTLIFVNEDGEELVRSDEALNTASLEKLFLRARETGEDDE